MTAKSLQKWRFLTTKITTTLVTSMLGTRPRRCVPASTRGQPMPGFCPRIALATGATREAITSTTLPSYHQLFKTPQNGPRLNSALEN